MEYRQLGKTGLIVSRLSFGAMTFGAGNVPAVYRVQREDVHRLIDRALDAGINFFDTADAYADGQSEQMLGEALKHCRGDVVISTKVGNRTGGVITQTGLSRRHIIASCEASLRRLGTDYIDLYFVHRFDPWTPMEETLSALDALVRSGKVRYVGFSNWSAWQAAKAVGIQLRDGLASFTAAQMYYSLLGRDLEHEMVPFTVDAGIGTVIWSPLAGGFLSGKYTRETLRDEGNRLSGFDFLPFDKDAGFALVDLMRPIAVAHGASVAQVALSWLLGKPGVGCVLLGVSKLNQLEHNLGAAGLHLSPAEMQQLDDASPHAAYYPNWFTERLRDPQVEKVLAASNIHSPGASS